MPEPAEPSESALAERWLQLPPAPRSIEQTEALLDLASDGHRGFLVMLPFFALGAVIFVPLIEGLGLPMIFCLAGPLLGLFVGRRVNRVGLRAVLRDGAETRGEIFKVIEATGRQPRFLYRYFVDGRESRHEATNQYLAHTLKVGMPVLVIHDRRHIGRHLAFFPPRFGELGMLLAGQRQLTATADFASAPADSSSPYRDDLPTSARRQLPFAPRPMIADARQLLGLTWRTVGWLWLTRALLRRGVETTGTIMAIDPHGEHLRVVVRYSVGIETRGWALLISPNDLAVAVGDTVPVLYSPTRSWLCAPFVTHQARALIERWNQPP